MQRVPLFSFEWLSSINIKLFSLFGNEHKKKAFTSFCATAIPFLDTDDSFSTSASRL